MCQVRGCLYKTTSWEAISRHLASKHNSETTPSEKRNTPAPEKRIISGYSPLTSSDRPACQRATPVSFEPSMKGDRATLREQGSLLNSLAGYQAKGRVFDADPFGLCPKAKPTFVEDCGVCKYCKDTKKFGGPRKLKMACFQMGGRRPMCRI